MKIACISYEYGDIVGGGIWNVITSVSRRINSSLPFHIFHLLWDRAENGFVINVYRREGEIHKRILFNEFAKYLQDEAYDILHVFHVGEAIADALENIKSRELNITVVYSVHSILKHEQNVRPSRDVDVVSEDRIFNACDWICYLNEFSRSRVETCYPSIRKKPYSIVQNGIDLHPFDIDRFGQKNIILCISRWAPGKGLEYFIDAASLVAKKNPNKRFVIAGRRFDSWEYLGNEYIQFIDNKINEAECPIEVLGWLGESEKKRLYLDSCICIVPSELEYFPYSVLEPVSFSVPVICSNLESVQEFFDDDCVYFESGNAYSLAHSMCAVLDDDEKTRCTTKNAWQKLNDLSWGRIIEQYLKVYCRAFSGQRQ